MRATAKWRGNQEYDTVSDSGYNVMLDADKSHRAGPGPLELVLMGLCSCTSVDVVSILRKKREPLESLTVSAMAEQAPEPPRLFTHIHLTYRIGGNVSRKAVEDSITLSQNKYCSVSKILERSATIDFTIEYVNEDGGIALA